MVKYEVWGHAVDLELPKLPSDEELKEMDEVFNCPEHGFLESTYEGKKLHYLKYLPEGKPKAVVVWQHGIHANSLCGMKRKDGSFSVFALRCRMMTKAGFAVYAHSQLGHGFSEGARFLIPGGNWKINRDDLIKFAKMAAAEHEENTPLFLAGDSYGGCLSLHAAREFQNNPETAPKGFIGCCLNAPAIFGDLPSKPVVLFLRYGLAPFFPAWTPFFMPHPVSPERIWKEEESRIYHTTRTNGLGKNGEPFSLGTAAGLLGAIETVQADVCPGFNVPFTINHGTKDYSIPLAGSEYLMEKSATPPEDKVLNKIEDGFHDLYSEKEAPEYMQKEIDWINAQISKKRGKHV